MISNTAKRLTHLSSILSFPISKSSFKYKFNSGAHMIPHPAKAHKGGEDAMFVSDNVIVVADGVGGWADQGIDPGLYSKKLCKIIGEKVHGDLKKYIEDPQTLLMEAWK